MEHLVGILAVLCVFGLPVAAFITFRVLAHRERMELIRRGIYPPAYGAGRKWRGATPPPGVPQGGMVPPGALETDSPEHSLRKGIMLALIGLAILIGLSFIGADESGPLNTFEIHPGPWLLGGLIPMFVGIAQIIVAVLSGARLGPAGPRPGPYPGPAASAGSDGYYDAEPRPHTAAPPAYGPEPRTHSGYEELKRPVPPPERR